MGITFLTSLSGGMLAALAACRLQQVAWKFVRLIGIVAFVLAGGALLWALQVQSGPGPRIDHWGLALTAAAGLMAFLVMVLAPLEARAAITRIACLLGGAAGVAAACVWSTGPGPTDWTARQAAILGGQVCGAMLLGTVTVSWMLGHAYLTATKMTIAPLRRLSRLLVAAVAVRIAYVGVCLAALAMVAETSGGIAAVWAASWPALSLRLGAGLVLLALFAYMVHDCVRLRSTQSATGILYFASLLAYVGELSSQHLVTMWGWPI